MRIKRHKNNNEYLLADNGVWVRNFCKSDVPFIDINCMIGPEEYGLILENELNNKRTDYVQIDTESQVNGKVVIVSNGYDFESKQELLSKLPSPDVSIIGINGALAGWKLVGEKCAEEMKRSMTFYVINNPYEEASYFLPREHRYFPRCIASTRTNQIFMKGYRGDKFLYVPTVDAHYSGASRDAEYMIDDYRNSVCAAIDLAVKFSAHMILLFCCDDSFAKERPASAKLDNGLWCYPQQIMSQQTIDAKLYWAKSFGIKTGDHSSGINYRNAEYISADKIIDFFENDSV